jgi:Xaa-Pro aminopeptidase
MSKTKASRPNKWREDRRFFLCVDGIGAGDDFFNNGPRRFVCGAKMFDTTTLDQRKQRVAANLGDDPPLILIGAGRPVAKPGGLDQTYPFSPHPEYYWLTGSRRWGGVLAFDAHEGWTHFVRPVDAAERLWEGDVASPEGTDIKELEAWLKARTGRPFAVVGGPGAGVKGDEATSADVKSRIDAARRPKDSAELELLRRAAQATTAGFTRAREVVKPGVTERAIQIEIEAEFFRHGADDVGYGTIVATGSHAAVLHFQPGEKIVGEEDVVLIDAGGAIAGYTSDVTRTFPAGERFNAEQQAIYDVVLAAQLAGIAKCHAGMEWRDVHRTAAAELAAGLRDLSILKIGVEESLDSEAIALFFPHGVGHMVGLGVRDVGGRALGREADRLYCGARLRVDLPIQEGFVMTIEPGIYFVPAILDDAQRRERFKNAVAWNHLERWRNVGGIRIEDNVLVRSGEPQVITAGIPK